MFNKNKNKKNNTEGSLDSISIHTMNDDLAGLVIQDDLDKKDDFSISETANVKEDSPFLNSNQESAIEEVNFKEKTYTNPKDETGNKIHSQEEKSIPAEEQDIDTVSDVDASYGKLEKTNKKSGFLLYVVVVLVLVVLGAGGYYIWIMKDGNIAETIFQDNTKNNSNVEITNAENNNLDPVEKVITNVGDNNFSEKTNLLVVSDEVFNKDGLKTLFNEKFSEMDKYSGDQLEFVLVDNDNVPIPFGDFAKNFGITLNESILNSLSDNFSVFLYNKDTIKRVDLVINIKEQGLLKDDLKNNESKLVDDLNSLLLDLPINNPSVNSFNDSIYNNISVRYDNLNTELNLSIDYYILGDYLVIATNKASGRAIMDKISIEMNKETDIFNENSGL
jgi:hypothetical protein